MDIARELYPENQISYVFLKSKDEAFLKSLLLDHIYS